MVTCDSEEMGSDYTVSVVAALCSTWGLKE